MVRHCWRCAAVLPGVPPVTCTHCGEIHYANPKPCGNAAPVHDGRILLVLRARDPDAGRWTLPGGFCEAAEHPRRAAERELWEETGLRGQAVAYLGAWMDVYGPPAPDGVVINTCVSGYLVTLEDPSAPPVPDPVESAEVRWFDFDELPRDALAFSRHVPAMIEAAVALARGVAAGRELPEMWDREAPG
jgi:8-oxo-dGTP diphosphatase